MCFTPRRKGSAWSDSSGLYSFDLRRLLSREKGMHGGPQTKKSCIKLWKPRRYHWQPNLPIRPTLYLFVDMTKPVLPGVWNAMSVMANAMTALSTIGHLCKDVVNSVKETKGVCRVWLSMKKVPRINVWEVSAYPPLANDKPPLGP